MNAQALLQRQEWACSDLWESHPEASVHRSAQQILCSLCRIGKQEQWRPTAQYRCYRNWSVSSAAVESDIIADRLSEEMYGLRYMSVIDDGNSSVMATIRQAVPYGIVV